MQKIILPFALLFLLCFACFADIWNQKSDLAGTGRSGAVGFVIDGKGFIGTGGAMYDSYAEDIWEYEPILDVWTQKADLPVGRKYGVGFAIGNKGYIGTGMTSLSNYEYLDDFWEYDPGLNSWTQKEDFPGGERFLATGFSIAGKGYIGLGADANNTKDDFWEYDPATNTWSQKADFGGDERQAAVGFGVLNKGYVGTGGGAMPHNDFWEYDPLADSWTQKANFGGDAREQATSFVIGNHGYIGIGSDWSSFKVDFWKYDSTNDIWKQVADFPGIARYSAVGFSIGNKGYVGTGFGDTMAYIKEFWEYTPDSLGTSVGNVLEQENSLMIVCNPAKGSFEILFSLREGRQTRIELYDVNGKRIKMLYDELAGVGRHQLPIDCGDIEAGIYLLQMKLNEEVVLKKIVIQ